MDNILVCESCGAKMRVRPATLKIVKELKCAKCRKTVIVPPEMKAAAKAGTLNTAASPKPAAVPILKPANPATQPVAEPQAPALPTSRITIPPAQTQVVTPLSTPVAPAPPVAPPPATAAPAPPVAPPPAPVAPPTPIAPLEPVIQATPVATPTVQPTADVAESGILAARVTTLEKTVADLEARITNLLKAEQQAAKQLATELEKI